MQTHRHWMFGLYTCHHCRRRVRRQRPGWLVCEDGACFLATGRGFHVCPECAGREESAVAVANSGHEEDTHGTGTGK